ncbi:structural maintenance of chromosomes 1 isoform X2 [Amblyomma americanum]
MDPDLVHGAPIGAPVSSRAHVTAVYCHEDGTETKFTRTVAHSSSEFRIDNEVVSQDDYLGRLEGLRINVKAKNFLVFQGDVETIAMKNPKERTVLFEEISHSLEHKAEYEQLRSEMIKAEEDTQFSYQKKKGIAAEKKEARLEKEEADKYQRLKESLAERQVVSQAFQLFHLQRELDALAADMAAKGIELQRAVRRKEKVEEEVRDKRKEHGRLQRDMAKIEQQIREADVELNKRKPAFIKAKERTAHMHKKLEAARKSLKAAKKVDETHQGEIAELEQELEEVVQRAQEFEQQLSQESQGRDVSLEDSQVREYHRLKEEAGRQASLHLQNLDSVRREHKSDQDRYDNEVRKRSEIQAKLKQKKAELEENLRRMDKLAEQIRSSEASLEELRRQEQEVSQDVTAAKERVAEINRELEALMNELGDAKVDKHEDSRRRKKAEIVDHFKQLYPGVYDRLVNMCQPIHKKYNVAITKVLGKNMEAIVVDSEKTGRACIKYLKEQMLEAETFLPLDYIDAKPLKERLRSIMQPKNVKLLYDVLQYDPPAIKRAVLYATNNALVCETADDASRVAYDLGDNKRYDAVALDGTYYQKNGFISGGSTDLAKRARRWDDKAFHTLKARKEKLTEELKEMMKRTRKESDLTTLQSQIRGLETRVRYSVTDRDNIRNKSMANLEKEIARLEQELSRQEPLLKKLEEEMRTREAQVDELREAQNGIEDRVFADFCASIGVDNIRQYEERELRATQERDKKKLEFENQKSRIVNRLEYERSKNTGENVRKWQKTVEDDEQELESLRQAEQAQMHSIDEQMQALEKLKSSKISKKQELDAAEESMGEIRKRLTTVQKDIAAVQKVLTALEARQEQRRQDRHSVFQTCKLEQIPLRLARGSLDDLDATAPADEAGDDTSSAAQASITRVYEREGNIQVDYSVLPDELTELDTPEEVKREGNRLNKEIADMQSHLQRIQAPNMRAMEKLDGVKERLKETDTEFENARKRAKKAKLAFEKVKRERHRKFTACFDQVSNRIDEIYKALTNNASAQAFLGPENPEEPYLEGLNYNCVAPGKRFQPMSNLSGGEKTVAALALLFAVHSYQPAPFFVLDEIDAALDNTNIGKVANFIRKQTETSFQCIVISLKEEFYSHADALVGIVPDPGECTISRVLTIDLSQVPE